MLVYKRHGILAADAGYKLPLEVLQSGAGWYIGTASLELGPVSRESEEYWSTKAEAVQAFADNDWTQRAHTPTPTPTHQEVSHAPLSL